MGESPEATDVQLAVFANAWDLIRSRGLGDVLSAVSLDDVIAHGDLSRATVYRHFKADDSGTSRQLFRRGFAGWIRNIQPFDLEQDESTVAVVTRHLELPIPDTATDRRTAFADLIREAMLVYQPSVRSNATFAVQMAMRSGEWADALANGAMPQWSAADVLDNNEYVALFETVGTVYGVTPNLDDDTQAAMLAAWTKGLVLTSLPVEPFLIQLDVNREPAMWNLAGLGFWAMIDALNTFDD